jgi:hypothetical protein
VEKKYTKPTRYNLVLSFEQYKFLLERKRRAQELDERVKYKDLVELWGIKQHHMASAVYRGIKQYDDRIKAERRDSDSRQPIPTRRVERRNEGCTLGVRPNSAESSRPSLTEHSQGGAIRRGYSDFIRTAYFDE